MRLFLQELKMNQKSFIIWLLAVGGMCFGCILLYGSVESSLSDMGDMFSEMGAMSAAFGMDRLSIATLEGYFATEIAMIHALGGAMFAASVGSNLLSKEEYGHTIEFLAVLPLRRRKIVSQKYLAFVSLLVLFQLVTSVSYLLGFAIMDQAIPWDHFGILTVTQLLLLLEVGTICFAVSSFSKKNGMSIGLGIVFLFFVADIMSRIVPAIENIKYVVPFSYCNATDIFTDTDISIGSILIGIFVVLISYLWSFYYYQKKDFSA